MSDTVDTVAALESCIGRTPGSMHLKVIDHLDAGARRWIASSTLMFASFGRGGTVAVTLGGGEAGFARAVNDTHLQLALAALDKPDLASVGSGVGALFLSPGIGETLRVNGRVASATAGTVEILVDECYVHCAKALIRSDLWNAQPVENACGDVSEFLAASRFLALATMDAQGRCDLSPKGDPAGAMLRLCDNGIWYAERPGNRRADSFRNILAQPRIAAVALIPGSVHVAELSGTARLTTDPERRGMFVVAGKTPLLATCIEPATLEVYASAALRRARLWPAVPGTAGIDPAALLVAHVKGNKTRGLQAALARKVVSVPGLMARGLQSDYENNLY